MNNQITVIDSQNQTMSVDSICYFLNNANNKKYLFYTKNEIVQDGLIKMYVTEENNGIVNEITPDEWTNLKLIMQGIIKGEGNNITMLPVTGTIKSGGEKVIALSEVNINAIKTSYNNDTKVLATQNVESNKDLLAQSFSNPTSPVLETTSSDMTKSVTESAPEVVNSNSDLESSAANLEMTSATGVVENNSSLSIDGDLFKMPDIGLNSNVEAEKTSTETVLNDASSVIKDSGNNIETAGIDASLSNMNNSTTTGTNIFDIPSIDINAIADNSQGSNVVTDGESKEVNNSNVTLDVPPIDLTIPSLENTNDKTVPTIDSNSSVSVTNNDVVQTDDKVAEPLSVQTNLVSESTNDFGNLGLPTMEDLKKESEVISPVQNENDSSLGEDIINARIALEKSNALLFKKLAENSEQMAKLLQSQLKNNNKIEHTASDLFNSNGALDEEKVMGKVA